MREKRQKMRKICGIHAVISKENLEGKKRNTEKNLICNDMMYYKYDKKRIVF